MRRVLGLMLAVLLAASATSCETLRGKEPWQEAVRYDEVDGEVVAVPDEVVVDGSFGRIQLTNFTQVKRGFAIEEIPVYEQILPDRTIEITVDEMRDGETYEFYDHLHPEEGPRGKLVVRFLDEDDF